MPEDIAERLRVALGLDAGILRIAAQEERLLSRNREICRDRLVARVAAALATPPPTRRPSRPRRAARAARLQEKRIKSEVKQLRRPPADID